MKKKLKILFLAPGQSIHSHKWINFFSEKYQIYWCHTGKIKKKNENIKYYFLREGLNTFFLPIIFFINILYIKPDIIHIHSISKNLFISFFSVIFFKQKTILNPWGSDVFSPKLFVKFLQYFIKGNIIFTDSFIIKKIFERNNRVFKVNFGIDLKYYNNVKNKNFKKREKIIFSPRGYSKVYNQFLLVEFVKKNKNKLKNFRFIIAGAVDKVELIFLKKYISKYNLKNLISLKSHLNKDLYKNFLISSYLVISASRSDAGLSSCIAEAMSSKSIVLCTNNRDNPYWIKNNINGFLFKDNDLKDLEKKFFYITNISNKKYLKISERSRQTQKNFNNLSIEMLRAEKIYKKIHKHSCFN